MAHSRAFTVDFDEAEVVLTAQLYIDQLESHSRQEPGMLHARATSPEKHDSMEPAAVSIEQKEALAKCDHKRGSSSSQRLSPNIDTSPRPQQYSPTISSSPKFTTPVSPAPRSLPFGTTLYKYKQLSDKEDIRLLSVSKSHTDGKIYFQLTRQKMADCAPYAAISYTWGSTLRNRPIYHYFTNEVLFVTENCEAALGNLFTNGNRLFWIDAICIDQDDIAERSQQVSIMADIFRNASGTVIYLGDSDKHSAALDRWRELKLLAGSENFLSDSTLHAAYKHVEALLTRSWHRRTWVIQEVLLSRALVVQAGRHMIGFEDMCKLLNRFRDERKTSLGVLDMFIRYGNESTTQTRHLHRLGWLGPRSSKVRLSAFESAIPSKGYLRYWQLFNLLLETATYQCRDPRDKLYALLSLFDGDIPYELVPNYSLGVDEVYANVSRFLLMSEGITTALSAAQGPDPLNSLPSWAVDWRCAPTLNTLMHGVMGDRSRYSAGLATPYQQIPQLPSSGLCLRLRGLRVAEVRLNLHSHSISSHRPVVQDLIWLIPRISFFTKPVCQLPEKTWPLDIVCVFIGFQVPFVMRPLGPITGSRWLLVGECLIDGIMEGQALQSVDCDCLDAERAVLPLEDFDIV